jgi:hypothetical protein
MAENNSNKKQVSLIIAKTEKVIPKEHLIKVAKLLQVEAAILITGETGKVVKLY